MSHAVLCIGLCTRLRHCANARRDPVDLGDHGSLLRMNGPCQCGKSVQNVGHCCQRVRLPNDSAMPLAQKANKKADVSGQGPQLPQYVSADADNGCAHHTGITWIVRSSRPTSSPARSSHDGRVSSKVNWTTGACITRSCADSSARSFSLWRERYYLRSIVDFSTVNQQRERARHQVADRA